MRAANEKLIITNWGLSNSANRLTPLLCFPSFPPPSPPPLHTVNLVPRPIHAGKRVWCALSDFLGLHDAKQSCDINYYQGNALSGMPVAHATTVWPHLRHWCTVSESDWSVMAEKMVEIRTAISSSPGNHSRYTNQTLFPVYMGIGSGNETNTQSLLILRPHNHAPVSHCTIICNTFQHFLTVKLTP